MKFRVLLADCPWRFGDKLPGETRGAEKNYDVMTVEDLCAFSLPPLEDDALLFLWRVSSMTEEANRVARAWGFVPKSEVVWVKGSPEQLSFGMGRYVRLCHEVCMIASRGKGNRLIRDHAVRSIFFAQRREHSEKPEEMYSIIERLSGGPYCELFARKPREGWTSYGKELVGRPAAPLPSVLF